MLVVAPRHVHADLGVAPLHLVGQGLADVVQQARPPGQSHVRTHLRGQLPRQEGHLHGVLEDVLAVGSPELQPPQKLDQVRVQAVHPGFQGRPLPFLDDALLQLPLGLLHHLLDAGRVDAAVGHEFFQGDLGHFPPHGVEGRQGHRLGGVVDDQVDPREGFQGPDVPALPADDPALHLVGGERHHRHRNFRGVVRGGPLDGQGQDLPGPALGLLPGLPLDLADAGEGVLPHVRLDLLEELLAGLLRGQAGDALEGLPLLADERGDLLGSLGQFLLLLLDRALTTLELVRPAVQGLLALDEAPLQALQVRPLLADLPLRLAAGPQRLFLGLQEGLFDLGLGLTPCLFHDPAGFLLRRTDLAFRDQLPENVPADEGHRTHRAQQRGEFSGVRIRSPPRGRCVFAFLVVYCPAAQASRTGVNRRLHIENLCGKILPRIPTREGNP